MLSQKCAQIISYLCQQANGEEFVRVEEMAKKYNVSERTIRYDIDKIDYFLKKNSFHELLREKGLGIRLDESPENIRKIKQTMLESNLQNYVMTKQERVVFIVMMLFDAEGFIKYDEIADKFFVSRKTAIEDVRSLKDDIGEDSLQSTKYGIMLHVDEPKRRRVVIDYALSVFTPLELWEITQDIFSNISIVIERKWRKMMDGKFVDMCGKVLRETENKNKKLLTDDYYYLVVILTALSLSRAAQGFTAGGAEYSGEDAFLNEFFDGVQASLKMEISANERAFIESEVKRILQPDGSEGIEIKADLIAEQFIIRISDLTDEKYYMDQTLRQSLCQHFERALKTTVKARAVTGTFDEYVKKNKELFEEVRRLLDEINAFDAVVDKESEAVLVMLHFLAASERKSSRFHNKYRVLVVCLNGIGTAKMISAIMQRHFPEVEIIDTASLHRVDELVEKEQPDFILSTVPVNSRNITVIEVHSMLSDNDIEKIRSFIKAHPQKSSRGQQNVFERLINAIGETCDIRDIAALESKLKNILNLEKPQRERKLRDMLTPQTIQVGALAADWEEAVRVSAQPLLELGLIEQSYVDAMVDNIIEMGPYVVIAPGIAMPHALPENGVNQSCIGLAVLQKEVEFGNAANDPVKLVFSMGSRDGKEHMNALAELINVISDKALVRGIENAQTKEEVMELLHEFWQE